MNLKDSLLIFFLAKMNKKLGFGYGWQQLFIQNLEFFLYYR